MSKKMRVLIGCEYSGTVRDAFLAKGHDAISCDLLDTESPGPHYKGNVLDILDDGFDLGIFHPPCVYLTISANKWFKDQPPRKSGALVGTERRQAREEAIGFFMALWNAPIRRICIENPVGIMSTVFRKPNQVIQPWMFGHPETKATCLWLKGLPTLKHFNSSDLFNDKTHVELPEDKRQRERILHLPPSADRWKIRSVTFPGIAKAMSEQWG